MTRRKLCLLNIILQVTLTLFVCLCIHGASGQLNARETQDAAEQSVFPAKGSEAVKARFLGIDVGDDKTNFEAGMWLLGLLAILATAIPAVFLDPSLGFKRKKRNVLKKEGEAKVRLTETWDAIHEMVERSIDTYDNRRQ